MARLLETYRQKLEDGVLAPDADQAKAVEALERAFPPHSALLSAFFSGLLPWKRPGGFYFYGGVGRGKSMVMDLFFAAAPVEKKRRVHFHVFMLEVHDALHAARAAREAAPENNDKTSLDGDLLSFAARLAKKTRLLCFDEFQVRDVADAMILGRLFAALFRRGVAVVMTSNIAPDDLYKDGLQRDRFLPFIALLKERLHVIHFSGEKDYRLDTLRAGQRYFWPHDDDAAREMGKIFQALAAGRQAAPADIAVKGRVIHVPIAAGDVAAFTFEELCGTAKSALDYIELAKRFKVFILYNVPKLNDDRRDATTRFVTFVDTVYDFHARLVMSAAAPPADLYRGEDNADIFARTASRLIEMQSREYGEK